MFHKTTPELQDQDHSLQDQERFFWSQTGLVLRLMVSDHITDTHTHAHTHIVLTAIFPDGCSLDNFTRGFGAKFYGLDTVPDANQQKHTPSFTFSSFTMTHEWERSSLLLASGLRCKCPRVRSPDVDYNLHSSQNS